MNAEQLLRCLHGYIHEHPSIEEIVDQWAEDCGYTEYGWVSCYVNEE